MIEHLRTPTLRLISYHRTTLSMHTREGMLTSLLILEAAKCLRQNQAAGNRLGYRDTHTTSQAGHLESELL